jgi:hypothetical protein
VSKRATLISFAAAILVQLIILVAVPARKAITLATGKKAVQSPTGRSIQSVEWLLRTLGFDISAVGAFPPVQGLAEGGPCYAVIEEGPDGIWRPVELSRDFPKNLSDESSRATRAAQLRADQIRH